MQVESSGFAAEKVELLATRLAKKGLIFNQPSSAGINDQELAQRDEGACRGCGICSRFCPEEAISLKEGYRRVFVMPPRLRKS